MKLRSAGECGREEGGRVLELKERVTSYCTSVCMCTSVRVCVCGVRCVVWVQTYPLLDDTRTRTHTHTSGHTHVQTPA